MHNALHMISYLHVHHDHDTVPSCIIQPATHAEPRLTTTILSLTWPFIWLLNDIYYSPEKVTIDT